MNDYITIPREGSVDCDVYPCDTAEQIEEAQEALRDARILDARVWTGEPPDSVETNRQLSATPRGYVLRAEDGYEVDADADTLADAKAEAADLARDGSYGDITSTIWIDVDIIGVFGDGDEDVREDVDRVVVAIDPLEPKCGDRWGHPDQRDREHKWNERGPYGHGGGVYYRETCEHCGLHRVTDTWAQRPDTGEQGLRSVSYEREESSDKDDGAARADYDVMS